MSKSIWDLIFGSNRKKGERFFEFGGETKEGKPWFVRLAEKENGSKRKRLKK